MGCLGRGDPNSGFGDIGTTVTQMRPRESVVFQRFVEALEPVSKVTLSLSTGSEAVVCLTGVLPSPTAREDSGGSWARLALLYAPLNS